MFKDLIGTPFILGKTDCWWLVREVFNRYEIIIPDYNLACEAVKKVSSDNEAVANVVNSSIQSYENEWELLEKPKEPCLIALSLGVPRGFFNHTGVYIGKGEFIHTRRRIGCCVEKIEHPLYKNCDKRYYEYIG